jgi:hypothetical protein
MFVVRGDIRAFNLPRDPEPPAVHRGAGWRAMAIAAGGLLLGSLLAWGGERAERRGRGGAA